MVGQGTARGVAGAFGISHRVLRDRPRGPEHAEVGVSTKRVRSLLVDDVTAVAALTRELGQARPGAHRFSQAIGHRIMKTSLTFEKQLAG
jgi:hypothetical protein